MIEVGMIERLLGSKKGPGSNKDSRVESVPQARGGRSWGWRVVLVEGSIDILSIIGWEEEEVGKAGFSGKKCGGEKLYWEGKGREREILLGRVKWLSFEWATVAKGFRLKFKFWDSWNLGTGT